MSGLEEVDPKRLMSLEAVQLLRKVDEDAREGTESKRLRWFGFGLTSTTGWHKVREAGKGLPR